jgi:prevent-host-death family protein
MDTYPISYFKTHLLRLLDEFDTKNEEFVITKRGKPIARVTSYRKDAEYVNKPGMLRDTVLEENDIVSPFGEEEWELRL